MARKEDKMIIEPGILDLAHSKGVSYLEDINGDGKIDNTDLQLALKAKASTAAPKVVSACSK